VKRDFLIGNLSRDIQCVTYLVKQISFFFCSDYQKKQTIMGNSTSKNSLKKDDFISDDEVKGL